MKRKKLIIGVLAILVVIGGVGCVQYLRDLMKGTEVEKEERDKISHYTCPMHPQVHEDHPGECPICHMRLVPVYKDGAAPQEPSGGPSVNISTERQQLIGVKTGPVVRKPVIKEIRTVGRAAFDPELAVAQREFIEITKNVPSLKEAARSRLRLLGMSDEEIRELAKTHRPSTNLYLPEVGDSLWVYAPLYPSEIPLVKIGDQVLITSPSSKDTFEGTVRAVDRVIDPMTRSARARIEVPQAGGRIKPETYLNVSLKTDLGEQLTVPKSAVIDTGERQVVFLVQEGRRFIAREVKLGPEAEDDRIVSEGLSEGEIVATSAAFLIDSESQLKAAIAGMEAAPTCPEGEEWNEAMKMCMPKTGG